LGMRRLRRSVKVATPRTTTVGHHASECIYDAPFFLEARGHVRWSNWPTNPERFYPFLIQLHG
jgi:hypothetical protein